MIRLSSRLKDITPSVRSEELAFGAFLYARRGRFSRSVRREEVRILACYKIGQIKIPKSGSVRAADGDSINF